jgi:Zn-dependent peptidase ImmA (M78 family)
MITPLDENPMAIVAKHQKEPPILVGPIATELGLRVYRMSLGPTIAGQLVRDRIKGGQSGFAVYLNSDDAQTRQKFTLAHEIAHFILHRDLIESGLIDDTLYRSELGSVYETQANQLAADILMPIRLVKKYREIIGDDPKALAKKFDVSEQAMKIRLKGLIVRLPQ